MAITHIQVPDKAGQTCLHVAAASGHYDMVQVLLGQGSDYNTIDKVNIGMEGTVGTWEGRL